MPRQVTVPGRQIRHDFATTYDSSTADPQTVRIQIQFTRCLLKATGDADRIHQAQIGAAVADDTRSNIDLVTQGKTTRGQLNIAECVDDGAAGQDTEVIAADEGQIPR